MRYNENSMKHPKLSVEKRTTFGKPLRKIRREGFIPGNIYGKGLESLPVQVPEKEFKAIYSQVHETGLVDIAVGDETRPVLIKHLELEPLTNKVLHADFYQVNLKEKITSMISLIIVGEAKAVTDKVGLLLPTLSEVEVEALPEDLPEHIEVNVENLAEVDSQITVGDLKAPSGVTILTEPEQVVVKISELISVEAKEQAAEEAAASVEAKADSEAPVEGAPEVAEKAETPVKEEA